MYTSTLAQYSLQRVPADPKCSVSVCGIYRDSFFLLLRGHSITTYVDKMRGKGVKIGLFLSTLTV